MTSPELVEERKFFEFETINKYYDIIFEKFCMGLQEVEELIIIASNNEFKNLSRIENLKIKINIQKQIDRNEAFNMEDFEWLYENVNDSSDKDKKLKSIFCDCNSWIK